MLNEEEKTDEKLTLKLSDIFTDDLKSALDDGEVDSKKITEILEKLAKSDNEDVKKTAEVLLNTITKKSSDLYGWKPKAVLKELSNFGKSEDHADLKDYCDELRDVLNSGEKVDKSNSGQPKSMDELKRRYHDLGKSLTIHAFIQVKEGLGNSKEASTSGEDFQSVAAEGDRDNDFMSTLGTLEDRYAVDAGGLAWTMIKKIKPEVAKEVKSPWSPEGDSENAKAKDALEKAKIIKKKFGNQFTKSYELLQNSFKAGCEEAKEDIKSGKELKDPLTGQTIGGDSFKKLFGDFSKEKLDNLGKTILSQKTDIITLGPQLAVRLLNSMFHKDGNLNRLFKIGAKGLKALNDKRKKKSNLSGEFDKSIQEINDKKLEDYKTASEIVLAAYKEFVQKNKEEGKPENQGAENADKQNEA